MASASLTLVGYWQNVAAPNRYPDPRRLTARWALAAKREVLQFLTRGARWQRFAVASKCRFGCAGGCGRDLLSDGTFAWPSGLAHYIEKHNVQLPAWFVRHARAAVKAGQPARRVASRALLSDARWLAWGKQRGASLPLPDAWQLPGAEDQQKIATLLATLPALTALPVAKGRGRRTLTILLARADTRAVICAQGPSGPFVAVRTRQGTARLFVDLGTALRWANRRAYSSRQPKS